jgi:hypothetical protein
VAVFYKVLLKLLMIKNNITFFEEHQANFGYISDQLIEK